MARLLGLVPEAAAIAIFALTYLVVAVGRLPGFRLDRAGAALVGASLMVAVGALPLEEAPKAIDFDTIILLLGVMIVVANLRLSGFFRLVSGWVVTRARYPIVLLASIVLVSGIFSAFLVNDTVCLVLTPLVLDLVSRLRRNPVPYLLAVAMASNIGSTATITGNPQNMIIGSLSHIPYGPFAAALSPIAGCRREANSRDAARIPRDHRPRGSLPPRRLRCLSGRQSRRRKAGPSRALRGACSAPRAPFATVQRKLRLDRDKAAHPEPSRSQLRRGVWPVGELRGPGGCRKS